MLFRRDRWNGTRKRLLDAFSFDAERLTIRSGGRDLSAVLVQADAGAPVFLICHGIGEKVEYWGGVQELLKTMGVSSLVFNYSGYGESSGRVSLANCEEDALAAYGELVHRGHESIFLLGFSLGSGVVLAVAPQLKVDGIILCEGYSTLREAAIAMGFPRWTTGVMPNAWQNVHQVKQLMAPVLVAHSDEDQLFPLTMARRVSEACGKRGELLVIPGLAHDAPIFSPTERYWRPVVDWARRNSTLIAAVEPPVSRS